MTAYGIRRIEGRLPAKAIVLCSLWLLPRSSMLADDERGEQEELISKPGQYQGYSKAAFDGGRRTSRYITVRDGTRIAIDIFRPTKNNIMHEEPLPVVNE